MNDYIICGVGAVILHSGADQTWIGWASVILGCALGMAIYPSEAEEDVG